VGILRENAPENAPGTQAAAPTRQAKELGSFQRSGGKAHIKLDGVAKTVPLPLTGEALHRLAGHVEGHPVSVSGVPNNNEPLEVKDGQEFTTALGEGKHLTEKHQEVGAPVPAAVANFRAAHNGREPGVRDLQDMANTSGAPLEYEGATYKPGE
jgi:hypothetical protein